ncbi:MAG: class II aldolase/adducin family protein [Candidatus Lokiarchaeota archaeon]|nr:class II aldolase/adducin family protein [Candidatus Lokiarchaeota archaeon]
MLNELLTLSKKMQKEGLVIGPGGNTSFKNNKDVMLISPSGIPFNEMDIDDFVPIDISSGKILDSKLMPSSEVPLHLRIYQARDDINCIIHAHPPHIIALSAVDIKVEPLFPDFVVYLGSEIPQIPYVTPCTDEMGKLVAEKIKNSFSCILKNHGAVTVGKSIKEAYTRMQVLESGAEILFKAKLLGEPKILSKKEVNDILNLDIEKYRKKLLEDSI